MKLTSAQNDRAAGLILGTAAGDALGAGYEFGPPLSDDTVVTMKGGGGFGWAPGEWTDDTSMAVPILRMVAAGRDLREEAVLDEIVAQWVDWAMKKAGWLDPTILVSDVILDASEPEKPGYSYW